MIHVHQDGRHKLGPGQNIVFRDQIIASPFIRLHHVNREQ